MTKNEGRMNLKRNPDLWCRRDAKRESSPAVCCSKILCFRSKIDGSKISTNDIWFRKREIYRGELIRLPRTDLTTYIHWPILDDDCFIINCNNYDSVLLDLMTPYMLPMFSTIFLFVLTDVYHMIYQETKRIFVICNLLPEVT